MPGSGIYSVTVPGAVKGWEALRSRFGTLPIADVLAPAIFYAEDGFPVTDVIANAWNGSAEEAAVRIRTPRRRSSSTAARRARARCSRTRCSPATLRLIAEKGPAGFYEGKTADAIVNVLREKGGTMTLADLKEYQPAWVDPISTTYRGWTVYELPPNTQGIAALMMLNLMEQYPLGEYGLHERESAARDDRSEEARVRRHAALRRGPELLAGAGAADARARITRRRARS